MPNQPKTPVRGFRVQNYDEARELARIFGDELTTEVNKAIDRYVKRRRRDLEQMDPAERQRLIREAKKKPRTR